MGKIRGSFHRRDRGRLITRLMARDGADCRICRLPLSRKIDDYEAPEYITFDHIIPLSQGGSRDFANIQLAHQFCNNRRGCTPMEFFGLEPS